MTTPPASRTVFLPILTHAPRGGAEIALFAPGWACRSGGVHKSRQARRLECSSLIWCHHMYLVSPHAENFLWLARQAIIRRHGYLKPNPMCKVAAAGGEVRALYMAVPLLAVAAMLAPAVTHADPVDDYVSPQR